MMKHVKVHVQEVTREGWMKHVPHIREESETARDWDPRTHAQTARDCDPRTRERTAREWDPRTHERKSSANSRRTSTFDNRYKEFMKQLQEMSQQRKVQNMMVRILSQ